MTFSQCNDELQWQRLLRTRHVLMQTIRITRPKETFNIFNLYLCIYSLLVVVRTNFAKYVTTLLLNSRGFLLFYTPTSEQNYLAK